LKFKASSNINSYFLHIDVKLDVKIGIVTKLLVLSLRSSD